MTTIAYDGKTLAGDSQYSGDYKYYGRGKMFKLGPVLVGCAGNSEDVAAFHDWYLVAGDKKPEINALSVLIVEDGAAYKMEEKLVRFELKIPCAIGSGAQFAMGAMLAGKTAKEAVEIAAQLDTGTGGEVITLTLSDENN